MKLTKRDYDRLKHELDWHKSICKRGVKRLVKNTVNDRKKTFRAKFLSSKRLPKNVD